MHNSILYGTESRARMQKGVDTVGNAVKVTLGPKGRHVIIQRQKGQPPIVTKDGVTVARSIKEINDHFEDIGAQMIKQAALSTAVMAGDGTTTATVLAQYLIREGIKLVESGGNPVDINKGIEEGVRQFTALLKKVAILIAQDGPEIKSIATISANNDESLGEIVAQAVCAVGLDGLVNIDRSQTTETYVVKSQGIELERGFLNAAFINNKPKNIVDFNNALVMLYPKVLSKLADIEPSLTLAKKSGKQLLIICEDCNNEAQATIASNIMDIGICVIKLPGFGPSQKDILEDIAIATGGTVLNIDNGFSPEKVKLSQLGTAEKIVVDRAKTIIIGAGGSPEKIEERVQQIRNFLNSTDSHPNERLVLEKRIARILGCMAVIYVGGHTDVEFEEIKFRIDDALRATQAALAEGIVPGGGITPYKLSNLLNVSSPHVDYSNGLALIKMSLRSISDQILQNAGVEPILYEPSGDVNNFNTGYNAKTGNTENLMLAGVIDPAKVIRVALENAASVTRLFLTSECAMVEMS